MDPLVFGVLLAGCIGTLFGLFVGVWASARDRAEVERWYQQQYLALWELTYPFDRRDDVPYFEAVYDWEAEGAL